VGWPLWCCWCDSPIRVGIGTAPFIVCNDCYEALDRLDALLPRMPRGRRAT